MDLLDEILEQRGYLYFDVDERLIYPDSGYATVAGYIHSNYDPDDILAVAEEILELETAAALEEALTDV